MHIIAYFQPEFGYKEYVIARNQVKSGHEVYIVTSDHIYPYFNLPELAKKINISPTRKRPLGTSMIEGITVVRLPRLLEIKDAIIVRGSGRVLSEIKPDLVIAYDPLHIVPVVAGIRKKLGYRLLLDHSLYELPRTILGKLYYYLVGKWLIRYMVRRADVIVVPTPDSQVFLERHFPVGKTAVKLIPLGFDESLFYFDPETRLQVRHRLGVAAEQRLLVTAGRIERDKKLELILEAMRRVKDRLLVLIIIGTGDAVYLQVLKNRVRELGLHDQVRFVDFVPRHALRDFYSAADMGIWPELPSISILEAIGCELPIVLPERKTVLHLGGRGGVIFFRRSDVSSLANVLGSFVRDPNLHQALRMQVRQLRDTYSYVGIARQYDTI